MSQESKDASQPEATEASAKERLQNFLLFVNLAAVGLATTVPKGSKLKLALVAEFADGKGGQMGPRWDIDTFFDDLIKLVGLDEVEEPVRKNLIAWFEQIKEPTK
jgi:hypothetical protein